MTIETVSPAGDTLTVYTNDEIEALFGDRLPTQALALMSSWQPRRESLRPFALLSLWHDGAAIDRPTGRAAAVLRDRAVRFGAPADAEPSKLSATVTSSDLWDLLVARDVCGKRTYEIRLIGVCERWLPFLEREIESAPAPTRGADPTGSTGAGSAPPAPEPEPGVDDAVPLGRVDSSSTNGHGSDSAIAVVPDPAAHAPVEFELTNAVATALLTQVVEIIATGSGSGPALGRLQLDVEALEARLGTQVAYVDKLRRQLREAGDEITALRVERDGLRQRLRSAEHNLSVATSADAQRIIDAEVRRQVDRLMRATPAGPHSKMAAVS